MKLFRLTPYFDKIFDVSCGEGKVVFPSEYIEFFFETFGRHYADLLYDGEYFALQIDAHMTFINGWDEIAITSWSKLNNDMAVLTTYPGEVTRSVNSEGDSIVLTAPIICDTKRMSTGMFKHEAAGEIRFPVGFRETPLITPYFGAGKFF